jgi:glycosyltransferase involved in cell wall biosynthesis
LRTMVKKQPVDESLVMKGIGSAGQLGYEKNRNVDILLSTYNGEEFLTQQIDSIISQTCQNWTLFIRDDGSKDGTVPIINRYMQKYPAKIKLVEADISSLGINESILRLLKFAKSDYIMFCDQDDVWLPNKIEITFEKIEDMESQFGKKMPILVHSDLKVCDKNLNTIMESFWRYQYLNPDKGVAFNRLLVQNVVTGLSIMINKNLKQLIHSIPKNTISYDWWIALVAAAFGKIDYISSPTAFYRQHENNTIGAKKWELVSAAKAFLFDKGKKQKKLIATSSKTVLQKTQLQADAFLDVFRNELTEKYINLLNIYSTLDRQNFFIKRLNLIKYRFFKIGFMRNIGLFWAI